MAEFKKKPGFVYKDSEKLGQVVAISKTTGWAYCMDGTRYSPAEIEILKRSGGVNIQVHLLKHEFGGTLIMAELKK